MTFSRRHFLTLLGATTGTAAFSLVGLPETSPIAATQPAAAARLWDRTAQASETFKLPPLPYAYDALEPHIDAETMQFHHDKHHAAYVKNLNAAIDQYPDLKLMTAEEMLRQIDTIPEAIRTTVRNNGGGHVNHSMFWEIMSPTGGGSPSGALATAIRQAFGSFEAFQTTFNTAGAKQFGSGWAWLVMNPTGDLEVISTPNQDSPLMQGYYPIMGNDVWEHAYYLRYRNKRDEYLKAWWNVLNWEAIAQRYEAAVQV